MTDRTCDRALHLDRETREDGRRRLLLIREQVEGILRMLDDESVYWADVLEQVKAVGRALDDVGDLVLGTHLRDHVVTAHQRGDAGRVAEELMGVLKYR